LGLEAGDSSVATADHYYRFESNGGCSIITLLPELNDKQWADIEKVGSEIVDKLGGTQSPRFVIDLSPLSYMGSAMVALIVRLYKTANTRNGQMVVVNQHELVHEVLKLAGLTKLWTIVDSRDKGLAALGVKPGALSKDGAPMAASGNAVLVAGIIGVIGAVLFLGLQLKGQPLLPYKWAQLIEFGFAALGIISGTMVLANQTGTRRNVGIVLLALCVLAVLGGIVAAPEHATSAPKSPPAKAASTSDATSSAIATAATTPPSKTAASANSGASTAKSALTPGAKLRK
jgi:anti-anti-sigma factor